MSLTERSARCCCRDWGQTAAGIESDDAALRQATIFRTVRANTACGDTYRPCFSRGRTTVDPLPRNGAGHQFGELAVIGIHNMRGTHQVTDPGVFYPEVVVDSSTPSIARAESELASAAARRA